MRVLLIRPARTIGGAEIYNLNLIKGFRRYFSVAQLTFITTLPKFAERIKSVGAKAIFLSVFSEEVGTKRGLLRLAYYLPKYLFFYLTTVLSLRRDEKINLVCLQSMTEKITLTVILKLLGFKVIWIEHGPAFMFQTAKEILILYRFMSKFVDVVVTTSNDAKENISKGGLNFRKIKAIQNSIDEKYFCPLTGDYIRKSKSQFGIKENEYIVGYVGSVTTEKGINEFLEVDSSMSKKMGNIRFILVGSGSALKKSKEFIREKGLEKKFIFTGFQEDIRLTLGTFDVFLFPTRHYETTPLALMEAMAMGIPVVARDIGGNRELVIHGKTGYLFKDETPEELADIIIGLLKDEKKRKAMSKMARERIVKHFNMKKWVTELHSVFEEVVKR